MSVNLYLDSKVRELAGFKSVRFSDDSGDNMSFNDLHVVRDGGRLYLRWYEDSPVPDELKALVEEISCYETIPQMGRREAGIYVHKSARCELTPTDHGNSRREKPVYFLKITAKELEDVREIIHKVKTGTIRPDESYEERQGGLTRDQLESELGRMQEEWLRQKETLIALRRWASSIQGSGILPVISKTRVAEQIFNILRKEYCDSE